MAGAHDVGQPAGHPASQGAGQAAAQGASQAAAQAAAQGAGQTASQAAARAVQVLDSAGLVVRGLPGIDRIPGGFGAAYQVLRRLEETGQVRRGYLVEGLGGAQFAMPEVVDRLRAEAAEITARAERPTDSPVHVLAATDPAQPYGAALPWPGAPGASGAPYAETDETSDGPRPTRSAGAVVILVEHAPVLYVTRGGRSIQSFPAPPEHLTRACQALADAARAGRIGSGRRGGTPAAPAAARPLTLEKIDGQAALRSSGPLREALAHVGFAPTPRGLRLPG